MQTKVTMSGFPVSLYVCLEDVHTREPGQAEAGDCGCLRGGTKDWEVRVGDFSLKPFCTFCILYHVQLLTIQKKIKCLNDNNKKQRYWQEPAN